eukprot:2053058-Prymnesium_polylepis.2
MTEESEGTAERAGADEEEVRPAELRLMFQSILRLLGEQDKKLQRHTKILNDLASRSEGSEVMSTGAVPPDAPSIYKPRRSLDRQGSNTLSRLTSRVDDDPGRKSARRASCSSITDSLEVK